MPIPEVVKFEAPPVERLYKMDSKSIIDNHIESGRKLFKAYLDNNWFIFKAGLKATWKLLVSPVTYLLIPSRTRVSQGKVIQAMENCMNYAQPITAPIDTFSSLSETGILKILEEHYKDDPGVKQFFHDMKLRLIEIESEGKSKH